MNINTMLSNKELRDFIFSDHNKNLYISPRRGYKTTSLLYKMVVDTKKIDKKYHRPVYICSSAAGIRMAVDKMKEILESNEIEVVGIFKSSEKLYQVNTKDVIYDFILVDILKCDYSMRGRKYNDFYIDEPDTFDFNIHDEFMFNLFYLSLWDDKATYNFAGTMVHDKVNLYNLSADLEYKRFYNNEKTLGMDKETVKKFRKELNDETYTTEILARFTRRAKSFD